MIKSLPRQAVLTRSIASVLALAALVPAAIAADGTFTNASGGDWNAGANWNASTIADGSGFTANFNTLDLTADRTVNLRAARTIGNLIFGDTATGTAGSWTISNASGETFALTLAGTTPTVTVNALGSGKIANLNVVVAGTSGLTKEGVGILQLSGANTLSGNLTVNNGTLRLGNNAAINSVGSAITVNGNLAVGTNNWVVLQLNDGITAGSGKTVTLNANTSSSRAALFGGSGSNWQGNVVLAGNHVTSIQAVSTGGTFTLSGNVTGGAGSTFAIRGAGLGNVTGKINIDTSLNKTEGSTWTFSSTGHTWTVTNIQDGQITLGINNALPNVPLVLGQGSNTSGRFELNGFNQTVASLSTLASSTGTNHIIRNSNVTTPSTLAFTTATGTTDILKNTHIQGIGALTLEKNGAGRFELQDLRVDNSAINVNDGTLAFTGTTDRHIRPVITGLAAATIDKAGTGTVNLDSAFNHAGATTISAGRMNFSSGNSGSITVADGATLGAGLNDGSFTVGALTFNGASNFAPILGQTAASALLNVTNLTTGGTSTPVTPDGANITPGTYKLVQYGVGSTPTFTLGAPGTYPHMTATLVNDTVARQVNLNVTAVDSLIWSGAVDGTWDINTTANFKLASNTATAAPFFQGDAVLFNDTAANTFITTNGAVRIGNLTFDNTFDYSITGVLAGSGGITKKNFGTVTLASANTFTGPISVSDGMLVLGGANTGHGAVTVTGGTLKLGNADAISGGAPVKISGGGTLDVAGFAPNVRIPELRISGAGVNGSGAVVNFGAGIVNNNHASVIILEGDTSWGGSGRYDITGMRFDGGSFKFTKVGSNETWWSPSAGSTLGPVVVEGGTFGIQGLNGMNTTDTITAQFAGTIGMFGNNTVTRPMILDGGAILGNGGGTPVIGGTVTLVNEDSGGIPLQRIGSTGTNVLAITGKLTGLGGFEKNNTGTVQIQSATHDYKGNTRVNGGTLNFSATGALPTTTNLIVDSGTFDPSNLTHTFASISGFGGVIGQGTAGTGRVETTQTGNTSYDGQINRMTIAMNGTGVLTLDGNLDNVAGIVEANKGTVVLGKGMGSPVGYDIHSLGSGLTVNNGGTVKLDGLYDPGVTVTGVNVAPANVNAATYVDQIYNAVTVNVNAGGTFDLNGRQEAVNGITQTTPAGGIITNTSSASAAKLFIGHQNGSSSFAGVIKDGGAAVAIEKIGTGTLTLAGTNTYTGATTLAAGTLVVNGALGNTAVTVASGTTLSGNGTIAGSVTLNGTLLSSNFIGSVTANNGSTINIGGPGAPATAVAATLNTNNFTLGTGGTRTLSLDFDGAAIDRINSSASNGFTLDGTNNVTILFPNGGGWKTGNYPVFGYAGTLQGAGASALTLANPTGHNTVSFVNDPVGHVVQMQVVQNDAVWAGGVNGTWDVNSTANWNIAAPPSNVFLNGDNAVFNDTATTYAVTIPANVTPTDVTFNNSTNNYTLSGAGGIAGVSSLVKKGTGTVTLTNPNTYTGNTVVQAGTLVLDYSTVTPVASSSLINVASGAVLKAVRGDADFTFGNSLSGAGTVIIDPHATANAASRQVTISGNNTAFTGTLKLSPTSGTFRVPVGATSVLGSGTVDIDDGGQVFINAGNLTFANNFTITGSGYSETAGSLGAIRAASPSTFTGTITVDGAAKIGAYSGQANVAGTLTGGDFTFGGNNGSSINETMVLTGNASGLTSLKVNGGSTNAGTITLQVGDGTTSGELGTVPITLQTDGKGGALRFRQGNDYVLRAPVTSSGGTTFQADTLAGTSNGKGLVLTNTVNINGGTFQVGTSNIANNAVAKLTIENGALVNAANFYMGEQANKQATVDQTGGDVSLTTQMRVGHWPTETSTYNLSAGSLAVTMAAGTSFPYGTTEQTGGIYVGIDGTGVINHTGGTLATNWIVLDNRGNTAAGTNMTTGIDTYSLSGTGLLKINSSFGIISRNATVAVNLGGGTIEAGTSFNLDSDKITVTANTTLQTNGNTITALAPLGGTGGFTVAGTGTLKTADSSVAGFVGGSLGGNPVALDAGSTLQADRTGTDTWSGNIMGAGNLVKTNTGKLTLSGTNSYTGSTLVSAGVLEVSGSIGGSLVTVVNGATLTGGGNIVSSLDINGALAPGSGVGTLTASGAADFNDGSSFVLELNSGVSFDKLIASSVTLDGTVNLSITLGGAHVEGTTYRIVDNTGAGAIGGTSGFFTWSGPQGLLTEGEHFYVNGNEFSISYKGGTGNDVVLTAVPEPGSLASLLGGFGTLLGLQRFRRRRG
ncbi:autotransporter-associated beta strand repeat-containing protein [Verrucomicrobiota bacterium sgz303538]